MKRIYLDHAATTYTKPQVLEKMLPYFTELFGNPSSVHAYGREAKKALDKAREQVAHSIGAKPNEIIFTGSGTEADNMAIFSLARANIKKGNHIITTTIEHHAVLHSCNQLEKEGFEVTYLPVDQYGLVSAEQVFAAIKENTILVTIMYANNEIGTILPIADICKVVKEKGILFHTDAVQAVGSLDIDVNQLGVDALSLSGHKFYAPKGIGALYVRQGVKLPAFIYGGAQERKMRGGTENLASIVGLGAAIELAYSNIEQSRSRILALRNHLIKRVLSEITDVRLNGHSEKRLPNNTNFCFKFIEGESLLLSLDFKGIAGSSGSACTSGSLDPSHVLLAIGLPHEIAHGSLRLSIGDGTTKEDIDFTVDALKEIVARLRAMSPLC